MYSKSSSSFSKRGMKCVLSTTMAPGLVEKLVKVAFFGQIRWLWFWNTIKLDSAVEGEHITHFS